MPAFKIRISFFNKRRLYILHPLFKDISMNVRKDKRKLVVKLERIKVDGKWSDIVEENYYLPYWYMGISETVLCFMFAVYISPECLWSTCSSLEKTRRTIRGLQHYGNRQICGAGTGGGGRGEMGVRSVIVWSGISYEGRTDLYVINGGILIALRYWD